MDTATFEYLAGDSGRVVCTRSDGCAGATLTAALNKHPKAAAWRGLNGEPYSRLTASEIAELAEITGGAVCDCDYRRVQASN